MRAWQFVKPGLIEVVDAEDAVISDPHDVLVRVEHCAICFSDKHCFDGYWNLPAGTIIGHEAAGTVVALGPEAVGVRVGDKVALDPIIACGDCHYCRLGISMHCEAGLRSSWGVSTEKTRGAVGFGVKRSDGSLMPGFFAEMAVMPDVNCHVLGEGITTAEGALVEPLSVGVRASRLSPIRPGDAVALIGFDDYACGLIQQLSQNECVAIDPIERRRQAAVEYGAVTTIDAGLEPGEIVEQIYESYPRGLDGAFVSIESYIPGSAGFMSLAAELVKIRGTVHMTRLHPPDIDDALGRAHPTFRKEISVISNGMFLAREFHAGGTVVGDFGLSARQVSQGRLRGDFASRVVSFSDIDEPDQIAELFDAVPEREFKVLVDLT